jgi:transposase-like protein
VRKRHSPEQIAQALRQAEAGTPVAEIVRKLGVHENTFYLGKKRFGGLGTPRFASCASCAMRTPSSRSWSLI